MAMQMSPIMFALMALFHDFSSGVNSRFGFLCLAAFAFFPRCFEDMARIAASCGLPSPPSGSSRSCRSLASYRTLGLGLGLGFRVWVPRMDWILFLCCRVLPLPVSRIAVHLNPNP